MLSFIVYLVDSVMSLYRQWMKSATDKHRSTSNVLYFTGIEHIWNLCNFFYFLAFLLVEHCTHHINRKIKIQVHVASLVSFIIRMSRSAKRFVPREHHDFMTFAKLLPKMTDDLSMCQALRWMWLFVSLMCHLCSNRVRVIMCPGEYNLSGIGLCDLGAQLHSAYGTHISACQALRPLSKYLRADSQLCAASD